jgi:hypothetical protein
MASCDSVCQDQEMSGLFVNAKFGKPASIKLSLQAQTLRFRVCKWVHDVAGGKQVMVHSHPKKDRRRKGDAFLTTCHIWASGSPSCDVITIFYIFCKRF